MYIYTCWRNDFSEPTAREQQHPVEKFCVDMSEEEEEEEKKTDGDAADDGSCVWIVRWPPPGLA